jgi:hypothetical protein
MQQHDEASYHYPSRPVLPFFHRLSKTREQSVSEIRLVFWFRELRLLSKNGMVWAVAVPIPACRHKLRRR